MFCRKAMLPFGSHQAPLYRGSRQNRLKGILIITHVGLGERRVCALKPEGSHFERGLEFIRSNRRWRQATWGAPHPGQYVTPMPQGRSAESSLTCSRSGPVGRRRKSRCCSLLSLFLPFSHSVSLHLSTRHRCRAKRHISLKWRGDPNKPLKVLGRSSGPTVGRMSLLATQLMQQPGTAPGRGFQAHHLKSLKLLPFRAAAVQGRELRSSSLVRDLPGTPGVPRP